MLLWGIAAVHKVHGRRRAPRRSRRSSARTAIFTTSIVIAAASPSRALSLDEALAQAYRTNPQLLAERAQLRATDEGVAQALADWRPSAQLSGSGGYSNDNVTGGTPFQNQFYSGQIPHSAYGVNITQALYTSGRISAHTDQAMNAVRAERAHLDDIEQQVLLKVVTDYADVVRDQATLDLEAHNEQVLRERMASSKARFAGGELSRADVSETVAAYQQSIAERAVSQSKLQISRSNFLRDVGVAAVKLSYPARTLALPGNSDEVSAVATTRNPAVLSALYSLDEAKSQTDEDFDQTLPQLNISASAQHQDGASFRGEHDNSQSILLKLTMPIYSGGALEAQTRAAEQIVEVRRNQLDQERANSVAAATSALEQLQAAQASMTAYDEQIKADEISLQGVQYQEASGERTMLDVLNVQHTLLQARVSHVTAQHDYIVAQYTLAGTLGRLTVQQLMLPVKPYDQTSHLKDARDSWFGFGDVP